MGMRSILVPAWMMALAAVVSAAPAAQRSAGSQFSDRRPEMVCPDPKDCPQPDAVCPDPKDCPDPSGPNHEAPEVCPDPRNCPQPEDPRTISPAPRDEAAPVEVCPDPKQCHDPPGEAPVEVCPNPKECPDPTDEAPVDGDELDQQVDMDIGPSRTDCPPEFQACGPDPGVRHPGPALPESTRLPSASPAIR
jgi:hypothetical protein